MNYFVEFLESTGIWAIFQGDGWLVIPMILISLLLLYLAIVKGFEPYLLIPIGFGMLLVNLPGSMMFVKSLDPLTGETVYSGLLGYLYY